MKSINPSLYPSFSVVLFSKTMDYTSKCRGKNTAALWLSVSDIQPQIHIVLAEEAVLLTVELFHICCMITLMAFKQDWESTVIDNLEIAIDNQCLPLSHHTMSIDKTARVGVHPPFFKDQNESKWPGMGNDRWTTKTCVWRAPVTLTKEMQTDRNFREIQITESSQNVVGLEGTLNIIQFHPSPAREGTLWLDQVAQSLTQADLEHFHDGACTKRTSKAVTDNNKILVCFVIHTGGTHSFGDFCIAHQLCEPGGWSPFLCAVYRKGLSWADSTEFYLLYFMQYIQLFFGSRKRVVPCWRSS